MKSSLEIERSIEKRPIAEVAAALGLDPDGINLHGKFIAKLPLSILDERSKGPDGSLILVTAMTPTREGIGKTTVTIGLADALRRLGESRLCLNLPPSCTSCSAGRAPTCPYWLHSGGGNPLQVRRCQGRSLPAAGRLT